MKLVVLAGMTSVLIVCSCQTISLVKPLTSAREFARKRHINPITLEDDPYKRPERFHDHMSRASIEVCAVIYLDEQRREYLTATFESKQHADSAGAHVTHYGPCGTCSSLKDLSVYLSQPDLTKSARRCAMLSWYKSASMRCFINIGFTKECASAWYFDAVNTGKKCFWTCIKSLITFEKHNAADNSLNSCIQCDEENSGPIFKAVAGRTRRNSGLRSEIARHPAEVAHIVHDYF